MRCDSGPESRYVVRISRDGDAFAWEIYREADSVVVHRSTRLFATRIEAILDSARAAATLSIAAIESSSGEDESQNGD
ncbi:hypothetical protein [Reyranella sp.]|jgi:hypothetical protein|uniref:hypothetical protein n=1 Tax=Reyranella sp. TaxID=1929291 RepID=UPI003D0BAF8B